MNLAACPNSTLRLLVLALIAFALPIFSASANPVRLTNSHGKSIRAEILTVNSLESTVEYRRVRDGRIFTSKLAIFDAATRESLRSFQKPETRKSLRLSAKASQRRDDESGRQRAVIELENRTSEEINDLEIDIIVMFEPVAGSESRRAERQTYPIRRIKGAGTIEVQTRLFAVEDTDVRGIAFRLREQESGNTVFSWKSSKLTDDAVKWDVAERGGMELTASTR